MLLNYVLKKSQICVKLKCRESYADRFCTIKFFNIVGFNEAITLFEQKEKLIFKWYFKGMNISSIGQCCVIYTVLYYWDYTILLIFSAAN